MKISCGIIILNEKKEILMGHVTGNKFFDIPKGLLEKNENPILCAIRECQEECGLEFKSEELKDLGVHKYNKEKDLHLFLISVKKEDINMNDLVCNSFFEHYYTKKIVPEVDSFDWIDIQDVTVKCAKSMGKLLKILEPEIINNKKGLKP